MNKLLQSIEEQSVFNFTGRINVLLKDSGQLLGYIVLKDGQVIHAQYKKRLGLKALFSCLIESESNKLKYIVEPEVVDQITCNIPYDFEILIKKLDEEIINFKKTVSLRPPNHLRIFLKPSFLLNDVKLTSNEFDVLCTLLDFSIVEKIYENCPLLDHEVTSSLVFLRKVNALVVK